MREKNNREYSGNAKHRRFLKRRCYLEQNGLLNTKQNRRNRRNNSWKGRHKHSLQSERKDHSQAGAVFPRFTSSQPELCTYPSSSMQAHHGNSQTIKESTVPLKSASQGETLLKQYSVVPSLDNPLKYIALDCEMVGTGPKGHRSELARCSIVSYDGDLIYDKFIMPVNPVTDFRTRWSGVRVQDLKNATPFKQAQKEILKLLSGKVVVGHAIQNDFKVLHYFHPACFVRDTAHIPILNEKAGLPVNQPASLKKLTKVLLNKDIQVGRKGHSSVDDAKATMELYKMVQVEWERTLASKLVAK